MEDNARTPQERLIELSGAVVAWYKVIATYLVALPVPLELPGEWDASTALPAVDRARTLIQDELIDDACKGFLNKVMIHWIAAHEIGALAKYHGVSEWRLDAIQANLASAESARAFLSLWFSTEDDGPEPESKI